jgi:hypothetical protein
MKRGIIVAVVWFALVATFFGQQARPHYDPAEQNEPRQPKQSFVDFTLHRLNPTDRNYGQCFDEARVLLLDETFKSGYFWSNTISLGLASCLFLIVLYQRRQMVEREWTIAEVLQQYEYSLARANAQVDAATTRNNELMEALTMTRESKLYFPSASTERQESDLSVTSRRSADVQIDGPKPRTANAQLKTIKAVGNATEASNQIGLFKPDVDLVLKLNSLEQQLERSQEHQKQLRRQLTQTDQRLQTEQEKNRTLKGA